MRNEELQNMKIKRILLYWSYLTKLRIDPQASLDFVSYIFGIKEQWILKIIRTRSLDEDIIKEASVEHIEIELNMIEEYARKLIKIGKTERPSQGKLF